jgi:hypothetical protein
MRSLILCVVLGIAANASAESVARDALTYIVTRYREAKSISPSSNREIALACSGEVLKDFVMPYFAEMDNKHLNKTMVTSYTDTFQLIQSHQADVENVYPKLRDNLIVAIRTVLTNLRNANKLDKVPPITLDQYGAKELVVNLTLCNAPDFIDAVARLAPLTGSYNDTAEGPAYQVPIGQDDGQFGTGDEAPAAPVETVLKQTLKQWLYEIYRR